VLDLDGDPASPPVKGHCSPQFSSNVCCGQTTGWTKMALGMEVGLGPGDFVFDRDPATPRTEGTPTTSQFLAICLLWPNGWMDEDATWYGSRPRPRPHCIRRSPSSAGKGHSSPHLFGPCLLWPRSPISATAELLLRHGVVCLVCLTDSQSLPFWRTTFAICYRPSVCLSVVCNVRAAYSCGSNFQQYFCGIGTLAIR